MAEAKRIFHSIFPEEEFLPAAPNPEDVVFDFGPEEPSEEADTQATEDGLEEDGAESPVA